MTCRRTSLGPSATVFTCGRSDRSAKDLPTCSNCGAANARQICQFELTGSKTGQCCNKPLCRTCVKRAVTDRDLCPPHYKLIMQSSGRQAADKACRGETDENMPVATKSSD